MKNIFHTKTADLYIRVSTDEQAYHGYSQRSQEALLRQYCLTNNITIRKVILEDHSAKTFNRPEWKKYLTELKKTKCRANLLLFIKWDRFSRNAGDAYQMIGLLRKHGVGPQAIEQPLDLSIPENKIMLAIYLSTPEVENDRRALNISHGMRQAKKEGRHISTAPFGYAKRTNGLNRKYIAIVESEAEILRWAFEQVAQGVFNTEQIYKQAKLKGYTHSKANFWLTLRNPLYIGKIHVPSYKDEDDYWVEGQHTAIIDKPLFYKVQHVLDARKHSVYKTKITSDELLPLRGFLICPLCTKKLTGSASRGAKKYYHYYHCVSPCKYRCRADCVNTAFLEEIRKFKPTFKMTEICRILINKFWALERNHFADQRKLLTNQINTINDEIAYIRELLASHRLEPEEYREMKTAFNEKIASIESELLINPIQNQNIDHILERALKNLLMIDYIYENGELTTKRKIVNAIFPQNMTFNGFLFRSNRINSLISIINIAVGLIHKRKGKKNTNTSDSIHPIDTIQFPDFFITDLKMLSLVSEL